MGDEEKEIKDRESGVGPSWGGVFESRIETHTSTLECRVASSSLHSQVDIDNKKLAQNGI
jgi:hypothetical protein